MVEAQKRLTLEELRAKTAQAIKEATTFEKTPTFDMPLGTEILFRVKKVVEGNFDAPIVIASELRVMDGSGKFVATTMRAYTQDGKDGPKVFSELKAGDEIRVPTFLVRRGMNKGLDFKGKEKLVFWGKFIEEKKVEKGVFKVAAIDLVGTEFPEA